MRPMLNRSAAARFDLVREAVGRADDEGHVSRAAVCAVGEELGQLLGGDLFSLDAQGDDGRAPADAAEDGSALFVQRLFHHSVGGVLLFDFFFRQLDDAERRKRRQTLLVFGHALGEVFRVELATQIRSMFCMVIVPLLCGFARWWRGAVFFFWSSGLRSARGRGRAGFFFKLVLALVARGWFSLWSNGFALRAGQR